MNFITVSGNLTRDSEKRFLPNNDAVLNFGVADNQGKDKDAIFWNCVLFGKRAEALEQYLKKGACVTVVGKIQQESYTDKTTGQPKTSLKLNVTDVALQGGKQDNQAAPAPQRQSAPAAAAAAPQSFDDFSDDIPF